jgi:hypothetical protein
MLDDVESFDDPFVYQGRIHLSPIKPAPPLKDIFTGQALGRLLDLIGCFARAGLKGKADYADMVWLGGLGLLREFIVARAGVGWIEQVIEALERIPGSDIVIWAPGGIRELVTRLRGMRAENWPFVQNTWVELLAMIDGIRSPRVEGEPSKAESKDSSLAGKKPVKLAASAIKIMAALRLHHRSSRAGELNLEPVGRNELARLAGVGNSSVDRFWEARGGSECYERLCLEGGWKLEGFLEKLDRPFPVQAFAFDERIHRGVRDETDEIDN